MAKSSLRQIRALRLIAALPVYYGAFLCSDSEAECDEALRSNGVYAHFR